MGVGKIRLEAERLLVLGEGLALPARLHGQGVGVVVVGLRVVRLERKGPLIEHEGRGPAWPGDRTSSTARLLAAIQHAGFAASVARYKVDPSR